MRHGCGVAAGDQGGLQVAPAEAEGGLVHPLAADQSAGCKGACSSKGVQGVDPKVVVPEDMGG